MIGADGAEYGPVTLDEFRSWATEGRVVSSTPVRKTGDEAWSAAANFPELGVVDRVTVAPAAPMAEPINDSVEVADLEKRIRSSGSWFYWIAALTLVNGIVALCGSNWGFVLGLTITQVIDALLINVAPHELGWIPKVIALAVNLIAAGFFVFLGVMACRRHMWAFAVGVTLYGVDTLFTLLSFSILSIGIHGWALFSLFVGMKAANEWRRLGHDSSVAVPATT
jgi:hypothetical protein